MPITDFRFEHGIFFARETGQISGEDALIWLEALRICAEESPVPIVVLIDARELTFITTAAQKIFAKAAETPNVKVAAIAASTPLATQLSRIVGLLSRVRQTHDTHVFNTLEEAARFARMQAKTGIART
jgi:anti-anti-sigma regulatory factor